MSFPERVYHYTTRDTALEKILSDWKIRLGSLGDTNDPRETKDWGFNILNPPNSSDLSSFFSAINNLENAANRIRLEEWWVLCMTLDDPDLDVPETTNQPDFKNFKYGYARPRMWAQYSNNHEGICLEFDGAALHKAISAMVGSNDSVFHGAVVYANEWDSPLTADYQRAFLIDYNSLGTDMFAGVRKHIRENHQHFFLTKSADWNSEKEFRWLVHSSSGPLLVDISGALKSVITGVNFPVVYKPTLDNLCGERGVLVERMTWENRVPTKQLWDLK